MKILEHITILLDSVCSPREMLAIVLIVAAGCASPVRPVQTQVNETSAKSPEPRLEVRWSTNNYRLPHDKYPNVGLGVAIDAPADVTPNNFMAVINYMNNKGKVFKITTLPGRGLHDAGTTISQIVAIDVNRRLVGVHDDEHGFKW